MTGLYNSDKTLKKGQVKDTLVTTLVDGYNGVLVYSALSNQGHFLADAYDGYGQALTSTVIDAYANKRGLDVFVLNQNPVTVSSSNDTNYGTVGANTLRTASQIGNATGAADFNRGATTAQTLRTNSNLNDGYGIQLQSTLGSLNVNLTNIPTVNQGTSPWVISGTVTAAEDKNYGTVGANTLRVASQIGNATGAADFNRGATGAQTLRTNSNLNDGYGVQIQSTAGSLNVNLTNIPTVNQGTSPWVVSGTVIANEDKNYGTVGANTLRSAAQIGNATGAADFNFGTVGAQTLRTAAEIGNATGLANFGAGTTGAQTLRVSANILRDGTALDYNFGAASANTLRVAGLIGNATGLADFNFGTVGAQTLRTAAEIGNATGLADFNRGATGAQTLRVTNNTSDGYGTAISSTVVSGKSGLDVNLINSTIAVTQSTSPWVWVVSGTTTAAEDKNYGTVGANTLRVASQIGNSTGAADFNRGANTVQTLRTTSNLNDGYGVQIQSTGGSLNTNITNIPTVNQGTSPWVVSGTVTASEDKNYGTVGANTLRVASQIGNSTGQADFNFGAVGAQTLRTAAELGNATGLADFNRGATGAQTLRTNTNLNDGYGIQLQSTTGSLNVNLTNIPTVNQGTSPWVVSGTVIANEDKNFGTVGANTLRSAAQIGNATGAADFNFGAASAQTLRTASLIGNATGLADFNRGATGAQTLRVTNNTSDGYGTAISSTVISGKSGLDVNIISPISTTLSNDTNYGTAGANTLRTASQIGNSTGAANFNYGTVGAQTLRVASQIGNATGAADFNAGATGAQTLRTASNMYDGYGNYLTSAANSAGTKRPLDTWDTNGTPQHFNGTVGTSAATITPTSTTTSIMVFNPSSNSAGVILSVSFDSGTTFFDIERRGILAIDAEVASFQIKASAASSNYQIIVTRR